MLINCRSANRYRFDCVCCQPAPGKARKQERRTIKRRERQQWKREVRG